MSEPTRFHPYMWVGWGAYGELAVPCVGGTSRSPQPPSSRPAGRNRNAKKVALRGPRAATHGHGIEWKKQNPNPSTTTTDAPPGWSRKVHECVTLPTALARRQRSTSVVGSQLQSPGRTCTHLAHVLPRQQSPSCRFQAPHSGRETLPKNAMYVCEFGSLPYRQRSTTRPRTYFVFFFYKEYLTTGTSQGLGVHQRLTSSRFLVRAITLFLLWTKTLERVAHK
jgi:hypothetical protein